MQPINSIPRYLKEMKKKCPYSTYVCGCSQQVSHNILKLETIHTSMNAGSNGGIVCERNATQRF